MIRNFRQRRISLWLKILEVNFFKPISSRVNQQLAFFGGGCFWCTDAVFRRLKGVQSVTAGYAGGSAPHPNYEQVSSGTTGHAEVIKIEFDPEQISYRDLLELFFTVHDPTTLNRQGADVGEQYRSIILYTTNEQRRQAEAMMQKLTEEKVFDRLIVTELKPFDNFYPAEAYHQDYYTKNRAASYCQAVINPKLAKLREKHTSLLSTKLQ